MSIVGLVKSDTHEHKDYKAALRITTAESGSDEKWKLVDDCVTAIAKANDEDVLFVTNIHELQFELEKRNPAPAGFTFISNVHPRQLRSAEEMEGYTQLAVSKYPILTTASGHTLFKVAKKYGGVRLPDHTSTQHFGFSVNHSFVETVVDDNYYYNKNTYTLHYDPDKVKKLRRSHKATACKEVRYGAIRIHNMCAMIDTIMHVLADNANDWEEMLRYCGVSCYSRRSWLAKRLVAAIELARRVKMLGVVRKNKEYAAWLHKAVACLPVMDKDMTELAAVVRQECKAFKLKVPPAPSDQTNGKIRKENKTGEHAAGQENDQHTGAPSLDAEPHG